MQDLPKVPTVFDSEEKHVGEVYAQALIGAGEAAGNLDEILEQFQGVVDVLAKQPKLGAALSSPRVAEEAKEALLERIFGGRIDATLLRFLKILARRGRLNFINGIQRASIELRDVQTGRIRVTVSSAQALSDSQKETIRTNLETSFGKKVGLTMKVEPDLLGGLVMRVGDTVYDGSVSGQLDQLARAARDGSARLVRQQSGSLISN